MIVGLASTDAGPNRGKRPAHGDALLDKAFALLAAFTAQRRSMSLTELSRQAGLPKSTTLRLSRKLTDLGVLARAGNGDFVIGLRLWEIASLGASFLRLRAAAMPAMEELNLRTGQHVLLAVRDGDEALLVERLSARAASPVLYRIDPGPLLSIAVPIWQDSITVAGALSIVVPATGAEAGPLTLLVRTAAHAVSRDLMAAGGHVPR